MLLRIACLHVHVHVYNEDLVLIELCRCCVMQAEVKINAAV